MRLPAGILAAVGLLIWSGDRLGAQAAPPPTPIDSGTVVRFRLAGGSTAAGRLLAPLRAGSTVAEYCRFPAPPCAVASDRYVRRPLDDVEAIDLYGGTRVVLGTIVGAAAGSVLGVAAILASRDTEDPEVGYVYAALSVSLLAAVGALVGVAIPVWHPLAGGT